MHLTAKPDAVYFDMDGTIADLYGVADWLPHLLQGNTKPYETCKPLVDMKHLQGIITALNELGIAVGVISWGAKGGTTEYTRRVKKAKVSWLERHGLNIQEIHVVKYGTPKHRVAKHKNAVLVDDEQQNLNKWRGATINASNAVAMMTQLTNMIEQLQS